MLSSSCIAQAYAESFKRFENHPYISVGVRRRVRPRKSLISFRRLRTEKRRVTKTLLLYYYISYIYIHIYVNTRDMILLLLLYPYCVALQHRYCHTPCDGGGVERGARRGAMLSFFFFFFYHQSARTQHALLFTAAAALRFSPPRVTDTDAGFPKI